MSYLIHKRSQALLTKLFFATASGHDGSNLMHLAIKCMKLLGISNDFLCSLEQRVCLRGSMHRISPNQTHGTDIGHMGVYMFIFFYKLLFCIPILK